MEMKSQFPTSTYWLTRILFLRCLSFIFFIAFIVAFFQNKSLIGEHGLTPVNRYLSNIRQHVIHHQTQSWEDVVTLIKEHPTMFWLIPATDFNLNVVSCIGAILSILVFVTGTSNGIIQFILWGIYLSIVNVGQLWYANCL